MSDDKPDAIKMMVLAILTPGLTATERAVEAVVKAYEFEGGLVARLRRYASGCTLLASGLRDEAARVEQALNEMAAAVDGE